MSDDEDDPVVQEVDVFLSKQLSDHLYLFQYPVRPVNMKYDDIPHLCARVKPVQQKVKRDGNLPVYNWSLRKVLHSDSGLFEKAKIQVYCCNRLMHWVISFHPFISFYTARQRSCGKVHHYLSVCHSVEGDLYRALAVPPLYMSPAPPLCTGQGPIPLPPYSPLPPNMFKLGPLVQVTPSQVTFKLVHYETRTVGRQQAIGFQLKCLIVMTSVYFLLWSSGTLRLFTGVNS